MQNNETPIAVVGMAGIFPNALNLETFWQNIVLGQTAISSNAHAKWDIDPAHVLANTYQPDKALHTSMGLAPRFKLETEGLQLNAEILEALDPMYHLLLQTGQNLFKSPNLPSFNRQNAGFILASIALPTAKTSALAKAVLQKELQNNGDILLNRYNLPQTFAQALGCAVTSAPSAIFAQSFGLGGLNYTLDAACASSLFAVKLACAELGAGRADLMLAGGLSMPDSLYTQIGFSQLKALSKSGRCAPFDANADGLIVGEGCGLVALKRLNDAQKNGDEILAVIRAVGASNDMSGTLLAPTSEGQVRAMRQAYAAAGLRPSEIDLIECHGAGTPLGDKTELLSLSEIWQNEKHNGGRCALSSVKSMTGHLLTAAGMAGLIKTILALRNATIPPSLNFNRPPEHAAALTTGPFYVPVKAREWPRRNANTTRKAAVSAFGFGGTNAHLLLEEWDASLAPPPLSSKIEINAPEPVAIVGMGLYSGDNAGLEMFRRGFLQNKNAFTNHSGPHQKATPGMYINELTIGLADFHISPNELDDILPQHLALLKAAREAMLNAKLNLRAEKPRMGALVGMDFDLNANNFCMRWLAQNLNDEALPNELTLSQKADFKAKLADYYARPLTHNRVLGNLGGTMAARLAKEFRLGAMCSTVSCGEVSGLRALDIAVNALQNNIADCYLAAAVDFTGDPRLLMLNRLLGAVYSHEIAAPFDTAHKGLNPGDAAVCLVLKRLDDAQKANDRIYAVLGPHAESFGWNVSGMLPQANVYAASLNQVTNAAKAPIELVLSNANGAPLNDDLQAKALAQHFPGAVKNTGLSSLAPVSGHAGAASGLLTLAAAALCLFHKTLPGMPNFVEPARANINASALHLPQRTLYWAHNHGEGARTALCSAVSQYGHAVQWLLTENNYASYAAIPAQTKAESALALAVNPVALFTVEGDDVAALNDLLQELWMLACQNDDMTALASAWHNRHPQNAEAGLALAFIAATKAEFDASLTQAMQALQSAAPVNTETLWYNPAPCFQNTPAAVVFPGSGNQYVGMGRDLYLRFPNLRQQYDFSNVQLKDELTPQIYMPYLSSWPPNHVEKIWALEETQMLKFMFGQIAYSVGMYQALRAFGIKHEAVAGYSLGESALMFATNTWNDANAMMREMEASDIFKTQLFGPCLAFHKAFKVPENYPFKWTAVWLNCPAEKAKAVIQNFPYTALMIVDTADECVIGGDAAQIKDVVAKLNCQAVYLHGVAAVHCKAVEPVADLYLRLHTRATTPNPGLAYYSCGFGKAYEPTAENVGRAMLRQVLHGFDFTKLAEQMYADGYRVFIEPGPGHSLSRILGKILGARPHLALSASKSSESENLTLACLLGRLVSERISVDLNPWFADVPPPIETNTKNSVKIKVYGLNAAYPVVPKAAPKPAVAGETPMVPPVIEATTPASDNNLLQNLLNRQIATNREVAEAHARFLELSAQINQNMARALLLKAQAANNAGSAIPVSTPPVETFEAVIAQRDATALYPRALCLEFARGLAQNVLGPEFAEVDAYPVRVRLPDEPLMLADRIMSVSAVKGAPGPGSIITEHDVKPNSWYLDGGHAPVCIAVEAGQADLFLSAYMGIDKLVQGKRAYRLLDAVVEFHRELPVPGEIIAYHINIERFLKHGETYIFFFNFTGYINEQKLITMTNGCAGFFTKDEVLNSGGILPGDMEAVYGNLTKAKAPLNYIMAPMEKTACNDASLNKLRHGEAEACFGPAFNGVQIPPNLQLAKGRMHLLDRILEIDPKGGRWGLGSILGEADIMGNEWFLECHFVDDKVMPGTLMYECCAHTLKVFLQRMGWLSDKPEAYYGTKMGVQSKLKCRGPVTPQTSKVNYALEIKEIGLEPSPYVLADAYMYADGHQIVWFQDMPMQLCHTTWNDVRDFWRRHGLSSQTAATTNAPAVNKPLFNRANIEEFCTGSAAKVFGETYAPFDNGRYLARLPKPPFLFIDRVMSTTAAPFKLETGHKFVSEFDIKANDWYFSAERNPFLPTVCLMEIALQPCGFSMVYMGAALLSPKGLHFRNLSGDLTLYKHIKQQNQTLMLETTLTKAVKSRDMLLVSFDFALKDKNGGALLGNGQSTFGFFPKEQLAAQKGFAACDIMPLMQKPASGESFALPKASPLWPLDANYDACATPALPAGALSMVDYIDCLSLNGGSRGLGFISGVQNVDPKGWFFEAHFPGDPVCPGSLGVDAFMQLLKVFMLKRFPNVANSVFSMPLNNKMAWDYRGQILKHNKTINVMADIIAVSDTPRPKVTANAVLLADGVHIYTARNIELELITL